MSKHNPRVPRKKGQPAGSKKHSDLYTDENPKGTIKGLKFATVKDAKASVSKINGSGKKHAHKIQAAVAMEQRAKEMGKTSQAGVYRAYINKMKKITKKKSESVMDLSKERLKEMMEDLTLDMEEFPDLTDIYNFGAPPMPEQNLQQTPSGASNINPTVFNRQPLTLNPITGLTQTQTALLSPGDQVLAQRLNRNRLT